MTYVTHTGRIHTLSDHVSSSQYVPREPRRSTARRAIIFLAGFAVGVMLASILFVATAEAQAAPGDCAIRTGHTMALVFEAETLSQVMQPGEVLRAYDEGGRCVGSMISQWEGGNEALALWGDDPMTEAKDGLASGEQFYLAAGEDEPRWLTHEAVLLVDRVTPYHGGYVAWQAPPLLITHLAPDTLVSSLQDALAELEDLIEGHTAALDSLGVELDVEREKVLQQAQTIANLQGLLAAAEEGMQPIMARVDDLEAELAAATEAVRQMIHRLRIGR